MIKRLLKVALGGASGLGGFALRLALSTLKRILTRVLFERVMRVLVVHALDAGVAWFKRYAETTETKLDDKIALELEQAVASARAHVQGDSA